MHIYKLYDTINQVQDLSPYGDELGEVGKILFGLNGPVSHTLLKCLLPYTS